MQKEYSEFQLKIHKYEKQITDGNSSQDTNSNSKEAKKNNNDWFIEFDILYVFFQIYFVLITLDIF